MTRFGVIDTTSLQLLLLGPGYGESVIVGVPGPPTGWLVVDSILKQRGGLLRQPVRQALTDLSAIPDLLLLTHAHADHAAGMARLIEAYPTARVAAAVSDFTAAKARSVRSAAQRAESAAALSAIGRLPDDRRWGAIAREEPLGTGSVSLLHPGADAAQRLLGSGSATPNLLSSPARIRWAGRTVLLGADLERDEWTGLGAPGAFHNDEPVKTPHHGSPGAFDAIWAGEPQPNGRRRHFALTPYDRRPKLPDLDHPHSLPGLLERAVRVHLTSLPFKTDPLISGSVSLSDLRAARDRSAAGRAPLPSFLGPNSAAREIDRPDDSWIRLELATDGACTATSGPAGVSVL